MKHWLPISVLALAVGMVWLLSSDDEGGRSSDAANAPLDSRHEPRLSGATEDGVRAPSQTEARALALKIQAVTDERQLALLRDAPATEYEPTLAAALSQLLLSDSTSLRLEAMTRLRRMGVEAAPTIMALLTHEDEALRLMAVHTFDLWAALGNTLPELPYRELIADPNNTVVCLAYDMLLGDRRDDPELARQIELDVGRSEGIRRLLALQALTSLGPEGMRLFVARLSDPDALVRAQAFAALSKADPSTLPTHMDAIATGFSDPEPSVRLAVLRLLANMVVEGEAHQLPDVWRPCIPHLLAGLDEEDETDTPTHLTIRALGRLGPAAQSAIPKLLEFLSHPDERLMTQSLEALASIAGSADLVIPTLEPLLAGSEGDTVARALAEYGTEGNAAAIRTLRGEDADAQESALIVVYEQGYAPDDAIADIGALLRLEDPRLQNRAALALGAIGARAASTIPDLIARLDDQLDREDARAIGYALGRLGPGAHAPLRDALRSVHPRVRLQALIAIRFGFAGQPTFALQELEGLLASKQRDEASAAADALLAALVYADGFARTPAGVDDRATRTRLRPLLERLAKEDGGVGSYAGMLHALSAGPGAE